MYFLFKFFLIIHFSTKHTNFNNFSYRIPPTSPAAALSKTPLPLPPLFSNHSATIQPTTTAITTIDVTSVVDAAINTIIIITLNAIVSVTNIIMSQQRQPTMPPIQPPMAQQHRRWVEANRPRVRRPAALLPGDKCPPPPGWRHCHLPIVGDRFPTAILTLRNFP